MSKKNKKSETPLFLHELGIEVKDKITGFQGIVVVRSQHMFGCNTYGVMPQALKDGKRIDTDWFDEGRLERVSMGIQPADVQVKKTGSLTREHPEERRN
jgi:hypothetical protein